MVKTENINFIASKYAPNPQEVSYWIDTTADSTGNVIKSYSYDLKRWIPLNRDTNIDQWQHIRELIDSLGLDYNRQTDIISLPNLNSNNYFKNSNLVSAINTGDNAVKNQVVRLDNRIDTTNSNLASLAEDVSDLADNTYTKAEVDNKIDDIVISGGGGEVNLSDYYTKPQTDNLLNNKADKSTTYTKIEVDNIINNIDIPTDSIPTNTSDLINDSGFITSSSLTDLATKQELNNYYNKSEVDNKIADVATGDVDLTNYYTKSQVDSKDDAITSRLSTLENIDHSQFLTEHQSLAEYAKTSEVDSRIQTIIGTAPAALDTLGEIADALNDNDNAISALTSTIATKANTSDVYTKSEVDNKIDQAIAGGEVDLSDYYTKTEVDAKDNTKVDKVEGKVLSTNDYTTDEKTKLAGLSNYDDTELRGMIADTYTKEEIDAKGYLTEHQDISGLATKVEVNAKANSADVYTKSEVDGKGYLTEENVVTTTSNGVMSAADKVNLDTTLPNAIAAETAAREAAVQTLTQSSTSADTAITNIQGSITTIETTLQSKASLDDNGKVPAAQLPSYVDDVLEYNSFSSFPETGESGKIYINTATNLTYRWSGTAYTEIGQSLALGETASTAYAGDKGKAVTDGLAAHTTNVSNPHNVTKAQVGLENVDNTSDLNKPISTATLTALNTLTNSLNAKVSGTGITEIKVVSSLPTNPVSTVLYIVIE